MTYFGSFLVSFKTLFNDSFQVDLQLGSLVRRQRGFCLWHRRHLLVRRTSGSKVAENHDGRHDRLRRHPRHHPPGISLVKLVHFSTDDKAK